MCPKGQPATRILGIVRDHESEHALESRPRPRDHGDHRTDDSPDSGLAAKAAARGRIGATGPSGVIGLQRTAGNAGVASALDMVQREMSESKQPGEHPLAPTHGEDEEER